VRCVQQTGAGAGLGAFGNHFERDWGQIRL